MYQHIRLAIVQFTVVLKMPCNKSETQTFNKHGCA